MADTQRAERAPLSLEEVAALVGGRVVGEASLEVRRVAPLQDAREDELGLLADRRYLGQLAASRAGALLLSESLAGDVSGKPAVVVEDAHAALTTLLAHLYPAPAPPVGVHPTAVLGRGVRLGADVHVGPYAVLEEDCELGDGVSVGAHVVIGRGARVGAGTVLHPHVVLYPGASLGRRVIAHAGVRIGSDGFGYVFAGGAYQKVPQVGGCVIEDDVELGANSCVDRGSIGDTVIGAGSKLDNLVHIAHNARLGPSCAFAALSGVAGSTRLGKGVVFGGQSGAVGHVTIGDGVRVSAHAAVTHDVEAGATVAGFPARDIRAFLKGTALVLRLPEVLKRLRALERRVDAGSGVGGGVAGEID